MTGTAAGDSYNSISVWAQGFGSTIDQDNRGGVAGFDADTFGSAFGVDGLVNNDLRVGAAFTYGSTDVDTNGSRNNTDIDSYQGALYASYEWDTYFLDGIVTYGQNGYDGRRHITVGAVNRIATADYDGEQVAVKGTVGRDYPLSDATYLTPYVGLHYVHLDVDGYTETGAGAANLTVEDESSEALQSTLGVSFRKQMKTADGLDVVPELHLAWLHEFLDEEQTNTSTFTGGGASFATRGFDPANDSLNVGASLSVYSGNNVDVRATYDFEIKDDFKGHSGMLVARFNF